MYLYSYSVGKQSVHTPIMQAHCRQILDPIQFHRTHTFWSVSAQNEYERHFFGGSCPAGVTVMPGVQTHGVIRFFSPGDGGYTPGGYTVIILIFV